MAAAKQNPNVGQPVQKSTPHPLTLDKLKSDERGFDYDPLGSLNTNVGVPRSRPGNVLAFPHNLASDSSPDGVPHYIVFNIMRYIFKRSETKAGATNRALKSEEKVPLGTIALPLPLNLQTGYKANHGAEELGAVSSTLGEELGRNFGNLVGSVEKALKAESPEKAFDDIIKGGGEYASSVKKGLLSKFSGGAGRSGVLNLLAEGMEKNVATLLSGMAGGLAPLLGAAFFERAVKAGFASQGVARNPHMAILYTGPEFRTHNFSFKLIAQDERESESLRKIIRAFKYYMSPKYSHHNHFFDYPEQFEIDFVIRNDETDVPSDMLLFNIGPSVLTSFDVNYHSEGQPLYFEESGAPVSVTLSMSFLENTITTKEEIDKYNR